MPKNARAIKIGVMLNVENDTSMPVIVVPKRAPRTKAAACLYVIKFISTNPILITDVADEDCNTIVVPAPKP